MKIMPEDANKPISELRDRIAQSIKEKVHIEAWEEIPIFGPLYALRLRFIVDDDAGGTAFVEELVVFPASDADGQFLADWPSTKHDRVPSRQVLRSQ